MTTPTKRLIAIVIGLALIATACSAAGEAAEGATEAVAAVEANETAYIEAFLAKDLDIFMDTMTEHLVFVDGTFGDYFEGKNAVRSMYSNVIKFVDPDASGVLGQFVSADGRRAISTWEWIGSNCCGEPFDLATALIHEYRDGKIVRKTVCYPSPDTCSRLMGS